MALQYVKIRFTQFIECDNSVICRPCITDLSEQKNKYLHDFSLKMQMTCLLTAFQRLTGNN